MTEGFEEDEENDGFEEPDKFRAVDGNPNVVNGLCPICVQRWIWSKAQKITPPAPLYCLNTVSHQHQCQDGECKPKFAIRKPSSVATPGHHDQREVPSTDTTRTHSKNTSWSGLFDKSGADAAGSVSQSGIIIFWKHRQAAGHGLVQPSLAREFPRKAMSRDGPALWQLTTMIHRLIPCS